MATEKEKAADKVVDAYFREVEKETIAGVKAPAPKAKRIPAALTGEQYSRIFDAVDKLNLNSMQKLRLRAAMDIGYGAGLRISEIMSLERRNVQPTDDGRVLLNFKGAKTGGKDAIAVLPKRSGDLVQQILKASPNRDPERPLFPTETPNVEGGSRYLSGSTFNSRMKAAAEAEGGFSEKQIKTLVSAHNLRHSFVTALFRGGADLPDVQAAARHVDPKTTLIYAHATEEDLKRTIDTKHPLSRIGQLDVEDVVPKSINIDNLSKFYSEDRVNAIKLAYSNFTTGNTTESSYRSALKRAELSDELIESLVTEASQSRAAIKQKSSITPLAAREAGAVPGTNLVPEPGTMPKSKRAVGAPAGRPFRTEIEGVALVAKTMGDNKIPVDKALQRIGNSAKTFMFELESEIARGNNRASQVLEAFKSELQFMFPDGLSFQGRFLVDILDDDGNVLAKAGSLASANEAEAISHALKIAGILKPVDPENKEAKKHLEKISTKTFADGKKNKEYKGPNATERRELKAAVDAGGAAPFTHVEYKQDKFGNTIKVFHRNELASTSERQPFFKVGGKSGFVLDDDMYKEKGFPEKDVPEWAKRKPNSSYIDYFTHMERIRIARENSQAKPRRNMTPAQVKKHTDAIAEANRVLGILEATVPEPPPIANPRGFEAASSYLLGEDYTPQQIPKAVAEPTTPALPDVERTPPLTKKELEDYEKALGRKRGLRGFGKGLGKLGAGFLGAAIGAGTSPDDPAKGAIEGIMPIGFEIKTVAAGTFEEAEEKKARIRGFPSAMMQEEQDVFLEREALTEAQRRRETARMAMPPSERSMSFMDQ